MLPEPVLDITNFDITEVGTQFRIKHTDESGKYKTISKRWGRKGRDDILQEMLGIQMELQSKQCGL